MKKRFLSSKNTFTIAILWGLVLFLITMLVLNLVPEIGDVINWDDKYYEIDNTTENQFFAGKNPDTWFKGDNFGTSLSFICNGHQMRESQLQLLDLNYGVNKEDYDLPLNI
jgi:hypothetical protein